MEEFLKQLREMLGLRRRCVVPTTSCSGLTRDVREPATPMPTAAHQRGNLPIRRAIVAVAEFQHALTELNSLKTERAREKAEHAVDAAIRSGKLVPAHREWAIAYCAADPKGFEAFAARQPAVLPGELNLSGDPRAALSRSHVGRDAERDRKSRSAACSASRVQRLSETQEAAAPIFCASTRTTARSANL